MLSVLIAVTSDRGSCFRIVINSLSVTICQKDAYLKELVRYIHLNPIRAGIIQSLKELNRFAYCGHSALVDEKTRPWQDVDYVLGYFGKTAKHARKEYLNYVEVGMGQGRQDELTGGVFGRKGPDHCT